MSDDDVIINDEVEIAESDQEEDDGRWKEVYAENVTRRRTMDVDLPQTVTVLEKSCGSKVYLVGTAHFSEESVQDVIKIMEQTIPDVVILELCGIRSKMLLMDDETLKKEMVRANLWELIKKEGHLAGVMHYLMLRMSNHVMDQMKMLPGGEFRTAFQKSKQMPCCHVTLGDRRIDITLKRALASLGLVGRFKFFLALILGLKPISKEDVEKMKKADILEELLKELGNEFPSLARVIVDERDQYLTKSIWDAVNTVDKEGKIPSVNVAVVGIGHSIGITKYWSQASEIDQMSLCEVVTPPLSWTIFTKTLRLSVFSIIGYAAYRLCYFAYSQLLTLSNSST